MNFFSNLKNKKWADSWIPFLKNNSIEKNEKIEKSNWKSNWKLKKKITRNSAITIAIAIAIAKASRKTTAIAIAIAKEKKAMAVIYASTSKNVKIFLGKSRNFFWWKRWNFFGENEKSLAQNACSIHKLLLPRVRKKYLIFK